MRNGKRSLLAGRFEIPIRYAVPGLLAIVIVVSVGLTALLTFVNGRATATTVAGDLSAQSASQIHDSVQALVQTPGQLNALNVAAWKAGQLDLKDLPKLGRYFLNQSRVLATAPQLYYATARGDFVGVDSWHGRASPTLQLREVDKSPDRLSYMVDASGNPIGQPSADTYDPTTQPFFRAADAAGNATMLPVTTLADGAGSTVVVAAPAITPEGKLQGVFGITLSLDALPGLLRDLAPSRNARAFVFEPDGRLIASSYQAETVGTAGQTARPTVLESADSLTRGAGRQLAAEYGDLDKIPQTTDPSTGRATPREFTFDLDGGLQVAQVVSLKDGQGLDWLVVVVVPLEDFMAPVYGNVAETVLLVVLALAVAAVPAYLFASRILRPIGTIAEVATSVEQGSYELERLDSVSTRKDELGHLARVFRRMAAEVQAREQQLMQQISRLKIEIDEAKRHAQVQEIVDSDFFRDLQAKAQRARAEKSRDRPESGESAE